MVCGLSTNLTMMIIGRAGQGITGGALIPTAMTIIATRLPPIAAADRHRPVRRHRDPGAGARPADRRLADREPELALCLLHQPAGRHPAGDPAHWSACRTRRRSSRTWPAPTGWASPGFALGLGCLTVVLEEGQREQWFQSAEIVQLSIVSILGFGLLIARPVRRRQTGDPAAPAARSPVRQRRA